MNSGIYQRIRANPEFDQLVRTRSRYAWLLALVVLAIFYGFVLLVAFQPALMGLPLSEGSRVAVGPLAILSMFVLFWIMTALYVRRANGEFDDSVRRIISQAEPEPRA
ncbi:MAG: DUF485 domain-containing protein [Leptothrix sp. (in: b-proteobacteria)]